jgi:hypothetical protein
MIGSLMLAKEDYRRNGYPVLLSSVCRLPFWSTGTTDQQYATDVLF